MKKIVIYTSVILASTIISCSFQGKEKNSSGLTDTIKSDASQRVKSDSSNVEYYFCEQGLFFKLQGNRIYGGVNFSPQTGSCLFVFRGMKDVDGYKIECADYNDDQLNSGKLDFKITGKCIIDTGKNVLIKLSKDPDVCNKAFGVSLVEGISFNTLSLNQYKWDAIGVVKMDFTLSDNNSKSKVKIYRNELVKIISVEGKFYNISYYDNISGKEISGKIAEEYFLKLE